MSENECININWVLVFVSDDNLKFKDMQLMLQICHTVALTCLTEVM